jgi:hypothetical protein
MKKSASAKNSRTVPTAKVITYADWIRLAPEVAQLGEPIALTVKVETNPETWHQLALAANVRGLTIDELISLIIDHDGLEFVNRGCKTQWEVGVEKLQHLRGVQEKMRADFVTAKERNGRTAQPS